MKFLYNLKNLIFILLGFSIPISVAFTNVLIVVFIFVWIFEGSFLKKFSYLKSLYWVRSLVALVFYYFIALLYGEYHEDSTYVIQRICLLLFFIPLASSKLEQLTYHYAILTFLLTNLLAALLSIAINNDIINPIHDYISIISSDSSISAFLKYNYHNILLSFSSLLAFALFTKSQSKYSSLYLVLVIIYSLSIFSEAGRAGQLTFNLFFIFYMIYFLNKRVLYSVAIICFLIAINFSSYKNSGVYKYRLDNLKHIVENNGQKKNPKEVEKDIRYLFVEESIKLIKQKPIFGHGTGSFSSVFKENVLSNYDFIKHKTPHNNFLYIFFEIGLLGLIIFLSLFYYQVKYLIKDSSNIIHLICLPFFYFFLMLFDSYLFVFTITIFYIFMFTIYSGYKINNKKFF
jgi:O-antigen ligase